MRVISGGQTGVDRGALDAALDAGVACGGWCPEGRKAEDGVIPERYPLEFEVGMDYPQRTRRNLMEADGTVIIYFARLSGGTEYTLAQCIAEGRPYLLIDASEIGVGQAARRIDVFTAEPVMQTVNIAGPRASTEPEARDYAYLAVSSWLRMREMTPAV